MTDNIVSIDALIGKTVLSRATGNTLGQVYDLYIDPVEGLLMGLTVQAPNGKMGGLDYKKVYSFGQDAVMANDDDSIVALDDGWVETHSHAKKHLLGIKIVTESGNLLGQVANIFVRLTPPPIAVYEVRESVLDKLLGRNLFIPASTGSALSSKAERIVVSNDAGANGASTLAEFVNRANANQKTKYNAVIISTPDDAEQETLVRGDKP
ncbi:MAG: PRC-barrel domain-containing protein [Acidobacteriota bacterium]|nr:PRC-barrel domain-containing protein [Acidobacteriota bacterium]